MEKTIICIGREYGSGGHAIGKILAKRTGYEFYDKERFIAIAKNVDLRVKLKNIWKNSR